MQRTACGASLLIMGASLFRSCYMRIYPISRLKWTRLRYLDSGNIYIYIDIFIYYPPCGLSDFIFPSAISGPYFRDPRAVFGHPRAPFWWPGGRILTPVPSILVAFWSSGRGLRGQWGTLAHFLEKGAKKVTNGSPTGAPNGTFFGTFSFFL